VRIDKPVAYAGKVKLDLKTPSGLFAGAYRQEIDLEPGRTSDVVTIPFSVSNLFEMGIQSQTIKLFEDGAEISEDTGIIRVASCDISEDRMIGFLADTSGLLEDILRTSGAGYRALTDRALWTADLSAYDVIIVGTGAYLNFASLSDVKGRLEDYIRYGGSLIVLGQPDDWPQDVLPVSFAPGPERVLPQELILLLPNARVLSKSYKIDVDGLLAGLGGASDVHSAVITPSERVLVTASGANLLSVSRRGEGQIIYCGLPLTDLISRLNLEAIHLFANLLNY
jgi:hypothetical protein